MKWKAFFIIFVKNNEKCFLFHKNFKGLSLNQIKFSWRWESGFEQINLFLSPENKKYGISMKWNLKTISNFFLLL